MESRSDRSDRYEREAWEGETSQAVRKLIIDGELWIVREVAAPALDRRGGTHLIFESVGVMRRLRAYPADWVQLSDQELYELSNHIR